MSLTPEQVSSSKKDPKKAALAAFLGSALEYYDFFIYGSAAALVFGRLFFPGGDPVVATVASLATFGVGYAARPLGGLVWGHLGDRIGRKKVLLQTLLMMGLASLLIGCLPTYEQIGILAPILLVLLRLLQGFSAGGEAAGAGALTLEHSPEGKRGFFTSFVMSGYVAGTLFGTLLFIPLAAMDDEALMTWGWRIPFWLSVVVLAVAYWVRTRLDEPEVMQDVQKTGQVKRFPLAEVLKTQWADVLRVALTCLLGVVNTIVTVFALSYATSPEIGIPRSTMLTANAVALAGSLITIPFLARMSDKIGRRPIMIIASLGCSIMIFAYFGAISTGNVPLIFVATFLTISCFFASYVAVNPSYFAEMFAAPVRYTGSAGGMQIGLLIAGFSPMIAQVLAGPSMNWLPVAIFTATCTLIAGAAVWSARETHNVPLEELGIPTASGKSKSVSGSMTTR